MTGQLTEKRCTKCGQVKPLEEFHKHPRGLGGRQSKCKTCTVTENRAYRQANLERLRGYDRQRNPARWRADLEANRERTRQAQQTARRANPEREKAAKRACRQAHPERASQENRRYRQANLEQRRERDRRRYWDLKAAVLAHYGDTCACCGATERLSIDHVNGDGAAHRREIFGRNAGGGMYRWLIRQNFPPDFQTLCVPCNQSKKNGERCRLNH